MADPSMSSASFQGPAESSYAAAWGIGSIVLGLVLPVGVPIGSIAAGTGFTAYASLGGKLDPDDMRDLFTTLVVIWVALAGTVLWAVVRYPRVALGGPHPGVMCPAADGPAAVYDGPGPAYHHTDRRTRAPGKHRGQTIGAVGVSETGFSGSWPAS